MRTLIFIRNHLQWEVLRNIIAPSDPQYLLVCLNLDLEPQLEEDGYQFSTLWDYVTFEDYNSVFEDSRLLAQTWYKDFEAAFTYAGFSVGKLLEWHAHFFFAECIEALISVRAILDKEKPHVVLAGINLPTKPAGWEFFDNNVFEAVLAMECKHRCIRLELVSQSKIISAMLRVFPPLIPLILRTPAWVWRPRTRLRRAFGEIASHARQWVTFRMGLQGRDGLPDALSLGDVERLLGSRADVVVPTGGNPFVWFTEIFRIVADRAPHLKIVFMGLPHAEGVRRVRWWPPYWVGKRLNVSKSEERAWGKVWRGALRAFNQVRARYRGRYECIIKSHLLDFNYRYLFQTAHLARRLSSLKVTLETLKPRLVVFMERPEVIGYLLGHLGQETRLDTRLMLVQGYQYGYQKDIGIYNYHGIDVIATWGEIFKDILVQSLGIEKGIIYVTGFSKYDKYFREDMMNSVFRSDESSKEVLVLTTHHYSTLKTFLNTAMHRKTLEAIASLSKTLNRRLRITLRPHPGYDYWTFLQTLSQQSRCKGMEVIFNDHRIYEDPDNDFAQVARSADVVVLVNCGPSAALEALLMKKPIVGVMTAVSEEFMQELPIVREGGCCVARRIDEIAPLVERMLTDREFYRQWVARGQSFLKRYAHNTDGKATERTADLILRTVEEAAGREPR